MALTSSALWVSVIVSTIAYLIRKRSSSRKSDRTTPSGASENFHPWYGGAFSSVLGSTNAHLLASSGNAHELKPTHGWLYYAELARKYGSSTLVPTSRSASTDRIEQHVGDVVSIDALGQPIISLSSFEACNDLLIKKSSIFQGRPHLTMAGEL